MGRRPSTRPTEPSSTATWWECSDVLKTPRTCSRRCGRDSAAVSCGFGIPPPTCGGPRAMRRCGGAKIVHRTNWAKFYVVSLIGNVQKMLIFKRLYLSLLMLQLRTIYCIAATATRRNRTFSVSSLLLGPWFQPRPSFLAETPRCYVELASNRVSVGWMSPGSNSGRLASSR